MSHHGDHEGGSDEGTAKAGGLGDDGTIPPDPEGLGATVSDEESTFEPEEDPAAPDAAHKPDVD